MNGNPHPEGPIEWWMGDSRGRWDGNTLVIDVIHFNDQTWFDRAGNFHSEALHVVERYTPTGPDHMLYEATIEDPEGLHAAVEDQHAALPAARNGTSSCWNTSAIRYLLEQEWNNPASTLFDKR